MVNTEKVVEDNLLASSIEIEEQPEEHKVRVSRKLKDILDARLFKETESKVRRESEQADQVNLEEEIKTIPEVVEEFIAPNPLQDTQIFEEATEFLQQATEEKKEIFPVTMSQPISILRNNDLVSK